MNDRSHFRGFLLRVSAVALGLLLAEGVLQLASLAVPAIDFATRPAWTIEPLLRDERLGLRGNPFYFEHDAKGFRNAKVPKHADVVTMGDSQTYGVNVPPDRNWPSALARVSGQSVYNISLAGFGAPHCESLLDEALALHPSWVVFAFYFGNDLYDAFEYARRNDELARFATSDQLDRIEQMQSRRTIADEASELFHSGQTQSAAAPAPSKPTSREWISDHSRLYGMLRTLKNAARGDRPASSLLDADFDRAVAAIGEEQRRFVSVFDDDWRTILTPAYRLLAENDGDPRIAAGLEVTRHSISAMQERAAAAGSKFALVLVPTKEFVFWPRVTDPARYPHLAELVAQEEHLREVLLRDARELGISVIDLAPALRDSPVQPYFPNGDGHPDPAGHEVIAKAVASGLHLR